MAAYTILAIAASARAAVQLATRAAEALVPYTLSAAAAVVYLVLAVALRRGGRWRAVAIIAAVAELAGVLTVGTWERFAFESWGDATVWSGYGAGYGRAPLVLPVIALVALLRKSRHRTPATATCLPGAEGLPPRLGPDVGLG